MTSLADFTNILSMLHQLSFFEDLFSRGRPSKLVKRSHSHVDLVYFRNSEVQIDRKAYQRSLNLLVQPNGALKVTAGRTVSTRVIQNFLLKNSGWIEEHLLRFEGLRKKYPPKNYIENEKFLFCGEVFSLSFSDCKEVYLDRSAHKIQIPLKALLEENTRKQVLKFYEKSAKAILQKKINELAEKMQLFPSQVKFRSLRSRWGSCSSSGVITLNWKLIVYPEKLWTYVIVHELAHIRHPNHSKNFWNLVEDFFPDYKVCRKYLSDHQYEVDFLSKKSDLYVEA